MKKLSLLFTLLIITFIPNIVKADTTVDILKHDFYSTDVYNDGSCSTAGYTYTDFNTFINDSENADIFNELYNNVVEMYNTKYNGYYYKTIVHLLSKKNTEFDLYGVVVYRIISQTGNHLDGSSDADQRYLISYYANGTYYKDYDVDYMGFVSDVFPSSSITSNAPIRLGCSGNNKYVITTSTDPIKYSFTPYYYIPNILFEINIPEEYYPKIWNNYTINIKDNKNNTLKTFVSGDKLPVLFPNGYIPGSNNKYTTVNLDNYDYVILTLKNYNQKKPFTTNLQVKGQIGITPIYNYGQTTKDAVTGVKVQDRCNIKYNNYTSYPFYILKQDLQNNVIYAVKKCSNGSEFKYDTTIFDITYVTDENKDDPIVTINGKQYHTIPFNDLPSTANKNEEENYIPGESGSPNSEGGLSSALKGIQQKMSEIWDIITFFSGFVNTMFSILPEPIRIILLSAFAIAITLGLIKIFIN